MEEAASQRDPLERQAACALFAAIAQMGLALRESQEPVAELGALLSHLVQSLAALKSAPPGQAGDAAATRGLLEQLQSDVFKGVQQLQFYDRMAQHLSHLQEYLISVANELGFQPTDGRAPLVWEELHASLRKRLISDNQRGLLDLFLAPQTTTRVSAQAVRTDYSPPGSFELF